jgi:omega-6 fatty acid desaturase (delta-12 desaturase)
LHHIHHLSSRIPSYRLNDCLDEIPALRDVNRIGLRESLSSFRLALWDEDRQRLVPFKALRSRATVD